MFATFRRNPTKRRRRLAIVRRFCRREEGAAAVEFALVMVPFLTLMFVILETALVFFAEQTLETAAQDSARLIMTGQAANFDEATFKNAVCARIVAMFNCSNGMYVDVKTYSSTDSISNGVSLNSSGKPVTGYQTSGPNSLVVVRLIYQWPISVPLVQQFLENSTGHTRLLVATVAFKNEPYTTN